MISFIREKTFSGGLQHLYYMDNSYGASVVKNKFSKGKRNNLWELAVIYWLDNPLHVKNAAWCFVYDTEITDTTIGNLLEEDIIIILKQIEKLKKDVKI